MTTSQLQIFHWLATQRRGSASWYRPSLIKPDGYPGGPSAIGRVLRSLVLAGKVEVRSADRGNGTTCLEYRAKSSIVFARGRRNAPGRAGTEA